METDLSEEDVPDLSQIAMEQFRPRPADRGREDLVSDPGARDLQRDGGRRDFLREPGQQDLVRDRGTQDLVHLEAWLTERFPDQIALARVSSRSGAIATRLRRE